MQLSLAVGVKVTMKQLLGWAIVICLTFFQSCNAQQSVREVKQENDSNKAIMIENGKSVITLGGGCFWCTEAVFQRLKGVDTVISGYMGGTTKNPTYKEICTGTTGHAEVIQVIYDTAIISTVEILEVFFATHDPTTPNNNRTAKASSSSGARGRPASSSSSGSAAMGFDQAKVRGLLGGCVWVCRPWVGRPINRGLTPNHTQTPPRQQQRHQTGGGALRLLRAHRRGGPLQHAAGGHRGVRERHRDRRPRGGACARLCIWWCDWLGGCGTGRSHQAHQILSPFPSTNKPNRTCVCWC